MPEDVAGPQRTSRETASEIANLIVRIMSQYTGRGPTKARAYLQDNLVNVVLRDGLTRGEQSLVDNGQAEHVLATRKMYQDAMRSDAVRGVEELTGRRVVAFLSSNHIDPDVAIETFMLEVLDPDDSSLATDL